VQEYILKGVVHAALGQASNDEEHLALAQQYFQLVGASASECDTIPGRQCMASCFYLLQKFDDVLIFLNSIHEYFKADDDYNWNLGIVLANTGTWAEVPFLVVQLCHLLSCSAHSHAWLQRSELLRCCACCKLRSAVASTLQLRASRMQRRHTSATSLLLQARTALLAVQSANYRASFCYLSWLTRCHVMAHQPEDAWQQYVRLDGSRPTDAAALLHLIANECYDMGHFYHSAKAFQVRCAAECSAGGGCGVVVSASSKRAPQRGAPSSQCAGTLRARAAVVSSVVSLRLVTWWCWRFAAIGSAGDVRHLTVARP
jgi:hypothetical protein